MPKSYSQDLRERVLVALERGEKTEEVAKRLEVSPSWVHSVGARLKKTGSRESLPRGGKRVSCLAPLKQTICSWIEEKPDLTLQAMSERLLKEHGIKITFQSVSDQLRNWGLTYKKNSARRRAGTR